MPAVQKTAYGFSLCAAARALTALAPFLLAACAAQPTSSDPATGAASAPPARIQVESPVLGFRGVAPDPRIALSRPLDANRLPPFEGLREELREPRGLARVDRTVRQDDVWQRIRDGFSMPDLAGPLVAEKTAWYVARPDYLKRVFERSRRYLFHIVEEIEKRGLPTELALLPMVESSFNPMAYSRAHASGLWQFIPGTGKRYELAQNWWYDGRRDIVASTSAALDYLNDVYEMHGDWHLALASYNWGENAVARAIEKNKARGLPTDYLSLAMPAETRYYVPKLQALKNIVAKPVAFGIDLDPIPNEPYFVTVEKTQDIDIRTAAKLAEMPVEELIALNPAYNRPVITAAQSQTLVLPADRAAIFRANLENHDKPLSSWRTYTLKAGEKLDRVAVRHGIALARLKQVNGIGPRSRIRSGQQILVPVKGSSAANEPLPAMFHPPAPETRVRKIVHTVNKGDTLQAIARRYHVSIDDLRRWNQIGRLSAGQKIVIRQQVATKPRATVRKAKPTKPKARTAATSTQKARKK